MNAKIIRKTIEPIYWFQKYPQFVYGFIILGCIISTIINPIQIPTNYIFPSWIPINSIPPNQFFSKIYLILICITILLEFGSKFFGKKMIHDLMKKDLGNYFEINTIIIAPFWEEMIFRNIILFYAPNLWNCVIIYSIYCFSFTKG